MTCNWLPRRALAFSGSTRPEQFPGPGQIERKRDPSPIAGSIQQEWGARASRALWSASRRPAWRTESIQHSVRCVRRRSHRRDADDSDRDGRAPLFNCIVPAFESGTINNTCRFSSRRNWVINNRSPVSLPDACRQFRPTRVLPPCRPATRDRSRPFVAQPHCCSLRAQTGPGR